MDDGSTALRTREEPGQIAAGELAPERPRRVVLPRHRRRRMVALLVIAGALSLIAGAITGAGGRTTAAPHLVRGTGFFGRIRQLAGDGAGSFTGAERQAENIAI